MEDLTIVLMLKLCQYVSLPQNVDTMNVVFFSDENLLLQRAGIIFSTIKIKDIPIKLIQNPRIEQVANANIVFVGDDRSVLLKKIWPIIAKQHVLLFTVNHNVAKDVMFNLQPNPDKGTITFELNRTNLIFEGFEIDDKIIELRGSEIDVRDLYRQTKLKLAEQESKMLLMQDKIDSQNTIIQSHDNLIEHQYVMISMLNQKVDSQLVNISSKENKLIELTSVTQAQKTEIFKNKELILKQLNILELSKRKFNIYNASVDSLDLIIKKKENEINQISDVLEKKDSLIEYKNKLIFFQTSLIVLAFILILVVANAYRVNKKIQRQLAARKEDLQKTLEKLTNAQEQLVRAEKMASLGILTAGIAHEINNPINFINSGLSGLKKINITNAKLVDTYREHLRNVERGADVKEIDETFDVKFIEESTVQMLNNIGIGIERTVKIVNSLRAFARSDEEVLTVVNIIDNIDLALTILTNQYKYNIEIIKQYENVALVNCYPGKINQVFMNLIANAIQAIPDKGHIWIKTSQENEQVIVSIKDDGAGIPDEIKNKIFDPFFTTKDVGKGTGMGLSIAFSIVEEINGNIRFNSRVGEGTEFIVTLPVK